MLKEILKEAGRYKDIMKELCDIITDDFFTNSSSHFYNGCVKIISGDILRTQAYNFFQMLENEKKDTFLFDVLTLKNKFYYLWNYIDGVVETSSVLNYHFYINPDKENSYKILQDLFNNWIYFLHGMWSVRDEWKKTAADTNKKTETCSIEKAREFVRKVDLLAKEMGLNYFLVTDGASGISNNGNLAVKNARESHVRWEKENGFDPDEDWSSPSKRTDV